MSAVPVLDNVTICEALVVFSNCGWLKVTEAGETPATGAIPTPVRDTVRSGWVGSLVSMFNVPARAPMAVGSKATPMVQSVPVGTTVHPLVMTKSDGLRPVMVTFLTVRGACPPLDTVMGWERLAVFTNWLPKSSEVG